MNWDQIIPTIFMIGVLILVLPSFLRTNSKLKQLFNKSIYLGYNCFSCYDSFIFYRLNEKINLAITGCMGRMGQQIIKSAKSNKNFAIRVITENRLIKKN